MVQRSNFDWPTIRARWEAGESANQISKTEGYPSQVAISKRAKKEGWETLEVKSFTELPVPKEYWDNLEPNKQIVIQAFARGARTIEEAAARADVHESTVHRWKKQDATFKRLCLAARLKTRDRLVDSVITKADQDWRAAAWYLSKAHADEFGDKGQPIQRNTFNVLGHINLGIPRGDDHNGIPESGNEPAVVIDGRIGDES